MYSEEEDEENPLKCFWMEGDSLAPPCQAELDVVHQIIDLAGLSEESIVFDLGCGDGRICLESAKLYGCKSVGVEIEQHLIEKFRINIAVMGLEEKVQARHEDLLETDLSSATVIVCYLLPDAIDLIKDKLETALRRGAILICNTWGPKGFSCVKTIQCGSLNTVNLKLYDCSSLEYSSDPNHNLYVTYCSKEKDHYEESLPAIDRYISARIRRIKDAATGSNSDFMILSGSYGLLDPQDMIPYYDHLLVDDEVDDMVEKVTKQFGQYTEKHDRAPRIIKYYEVSEDPFVNPYRRVVEQLCSNYGIDIDVISTYE